MRKLLNSIIKYAIYSLVFLIPLFWLPFTVEVHEFSKQYLLLALGGLAFIVWLIKMIIIRKRIAMHRTPLDIWILIFMVVLALSAVFSLDRPLSLLGAYGRFSDSSLVFLMAGLLYFTIANNSHISIRTLMKLFYAASLIAVVIGYLSLFEVWKPLSGLPPVMARQSFQTVAASLEGFVIFLAVAMAVSVGLLLGPRTKSGLVPRLGRLLHYVFLAAAALMLVLVNFQPAWLVLTVSMFLTLVVAFWMGLPRPRLGWLLTPLTLLLIALLYLAGIAGGLGWAGGTLILDTGLPQEIILDSSVSWQIAWQSVKTYPVLGSGPATFLANFARFKPEIMNSGQFWNIRFDSASNHILNLLSTTGWLGLLSYLFMTIIFVLIVFQALRKNRQRKAVLERPDLLLAAIVGWAALLTAQFVYPQNIVLVFFFWLFMALSVVLWQREAVLKGKESKLLFKNVPEIGLVLNVILLLVVFAAAGAYYLGGQFYLADVWFRQSLESSDNDEALRHLERAVDWNQYRNNYRRALSTSYLNLALLENAEPAEERDVDYLQSLMSQAIQQAKTAASMSPNMVGAWENLGLIYINSRGLVNGTLPFALNALAKASELEPANPLFWQERCRLVLGQDSGDWSQAIDYCQTAIKLKPNNLDAHIQLALAYEKQGDAQEALRRMETTLGQLRGVSFARGSALADAAAEIYFQLGRLHFNLEHLDEAMNMLEQAVVVVPGHINARFSLGTAYQAKGKTNDAFTQFKILDEIIPGNEQVEQLLAALAAQGAVDVRD